MSRREDDEVSAIFAAQAAAERTAEAKSAAEAEATRKRVVAVPVDRIDKVRAACGDAHVLLQQIARDYLKLSPTHKIRITQVCIALRHEPFMLERELRPVPVVAGDTSVAVAGDTSATRRSPAKKARKRAKPAAKKRGTAARAKGERAKARPGRRATSP